MVAPKDTSPDAFARQLDALRRMRPEQRLQLALEMSDEVRELAKAGIRGRHPAYTDTEVADALEALLLGTDLAMAARRGRLASAR